MDILAERVTDLLEETHREHNKTLKASPEYVDFDSTLSNDPVYIQLKEFEEKFRKFEDLKLDLEQFATHQGLSFNKWESKPATALRESYAQKKKREKFPHANFERDKTLRRVQSDILLSDVTNPEELIQSLVEKLKN